jgi:hypothetical protein
MQPVGQALWSERSNSRPLGVRANGRKSNDQLPDIGRARKVVESPNGKWAIAISTKSRKAPGEGAHAWALNLTLAKSPSRVPSLGESDPKVENNRAGYPLNSTR